MSAQELRKAAETLRERAKATTPGPWSSEKIYEDVHAVYPVPCSDHYVPDSDPYCRVIDHAAAYIATMHPGVGLALADWLDYSARGFDAVGSPSPEHEGAFPMIRLARLINGGA